MNNKKYQVFISSTYTDLHEERQAAVEAILKSGHIPAGMELFAAGDESQLETIKRWIEASDIYMLILGARYGSIEPKTGLAYIECEYDYAVSIQKPLFSIVASDKLTNKKAEQFGKDVVETNLPAYKSFHKKVLSKTSSFFEDCKDIKLAIHESISEIQNRYELTGWVSASEIQDTKSLVSYVDRLLEENANFKRENVNLQKRLAKPRSNINDPQQYEVLEKVLENIIVETKVFDKTKGLQKFSVFALFAAAKLAFVSGITNASNVNAAGLMVYQKVCPHLQIHGLVINEKVPGKNFHKFTLTKLGMEFLAYLDRKELLEYSSNTGDSS